MGLLTKVEDRPTPKAVYNWKVYFAFIGGTLALDSFKTQFGFDKLSKSQLALTSANIVSSYQAGAFFGG
jgi:hypothetical protein